VRAGVAYVLNYTEQQAAQDYAAATIRNFWAEKSIFGKNRLRESLIGMARRGHAVDAIVAALIADAQDEDGFNAATAVSALGDIGYNAKAGAFLFEGRLAEARKRLAGAKTDRDRQNAERTVKKLEGTLRRLTTPPAPPKPPKKKRR